MSQNIHDYLCKAIVGRFCKLSMAMTSDYGSKYSAVYAKQISSFLVNGNYTKA